MKNKKVRWGIVGLLAIVAACVLPPLSKPKAQPTRAHSVNRVASVSWTVPSTATEGK